MHTCDICQKELRTAKRLSGHKQFLHKLLPSGDEARSYATLATEEVVYEGLNALEGDLQEELKQLEQRISQLGSKAELSEVTERQERIETAISTITGFAKSLSAVVLHLDEHQHGDKFRGLLFRSGGLIVDGIEVDDPGVEWWKEEVYEQKRDIVVQELKGR